MATASAQEEFMEKAFDHIWVIPNWHNATQNETLLENTSTEIYCKEGSLEYAKFIVGFNIRRSGQYRKLFFKWKLLRKFYSLETVEAHLFIQYLTREGEKCGLFESHTNPELGKTLEIHPAFWPLIPTVDTSLPWTNAEGAMVILLKLTLKNLPKLVCYSKTKEFQNACEDEYRKDLTALLEDTSNTDVKIVTKDNFELFAHKNILRARCPVFASMFGSGFLENSTGLVNVEDITAKTMKILLRYWYTGSLLPSWEDADTIVEFAYAAGKYQMTNILKMLDNSLGSDFQAANVHVRLLKMVHELSLKNAEARILKLVVYKVTQAQNAAALFNTLSLSNEYFDEGHFTVLQVLKAFDDAYSEDTDMKACFRDVKLLKLACKNGMKNVEGKLFKRIIAAVNKVGSAVELFALFDLQDKTTIEVVEVREPTRAIHEITNFNL